MSKKLEGNGLWEGSRMMLPEHKIAINAWSKTTTIRTRIELATHEIEEISRVLAESFQMRVTVKVFLYDKYEQSEVIGIIEKIDQYRRRFMVNETWIMFEDLEGAQLLSGKWD